AAMTDRAPLRNRTVQAVVALALVGLLARLVFLRARVAHFDEARVAYWTLHYLNTGEFHYRYIIHGPFIQHVGRPLFALFGTTDFAARLPVAVVGGLFPLVALWFRHRLAAVEVGGLAFFLAVNPLLLYYGRFMRSTLLVAAFCFVAFAAFVRAYDGFGSQYLYVGAAIAKLVRGDDAGVDRLARWRDAAVTRLRTDGAFDPMAVRWTGHVVGAALVFAVVAVFMYAPRGGEWVGLYDALANPLLIPEMLSTTVDQVATGYGYWFGGPGETKLSTVVDQLGISAKAVGGYAAPLFLLSVGGFLAERYGRDSPRQFVLGCAYWGFVSVPGYALATDILNAWVLTNALVPLAVPAAVGLARLVDIGRESLVREDAVSVGVVALLFVLVVGAVAGGAATGVYANTTSPDNALVQYAQPSQEMRAAVNDIDKVAAGTEGTDVYVYGGGNEDFVDGDGNATREPACITWFRTLPFGWYLSADEATVECGNAPEDIPSELPPVVVVPGECTLERTVDCRDRPTAIEPPEGVADRVDGYERHAFLHRTTGGNWFDGMIVYVDEDR
ncbi:TIGR03663 family protein, partial [Halobacteriales archaeon QS_9_67_17]